MEPQLLGKVLKKFVQSKPLGENLSQIEILSKWEELFNPPICTHARPCGIKNKRLLIEVSSSAWLNELSFYKEEMKNRINREADKEIINEIYLYLRED